MQSAQAHSDEFVNRTRRVQLYGRGKNSIYRREAPGKRGTIRDDVASAAQGGGTTLSIRERANAAANKVLKRSCCARSKLGQHEAALFVGDSQLEALFDHLCERKTKRCSRAGSTNIVMVVAAGRWARHYPSFYTAQISLSHWPSQVTLPTLVLSNFASPHLLHVHPARPLLDVNSIRAPGCYPQSTCADYSGLVNLDDWIANDVLEFRRRLADPKVVLMGPNWICDRMLYNAYQKKLRLSKEARTHPCLEWIRKRPRSFQPAAPRVTDSQVCDYFTFSGTGSDAISYRMEAAARDQNISWLPATDITRDHCNMTSDARHYPGLVPNQIEALLSLL